MIFQVRVVTLQMTKIFRNMAISKNLILVDVLIVVGAMLVAVHLYKLSREIFSSHSPDSQINSEQTETRTVSPGAGK